MTAVQQSFTRVGDISLHYELADYTDPWRAREPETLLLYSGYCRTTEFWRAWVPLLARDYRVLRFDPRGYGASDKPAPDSTLTAELLTRDAFGLLDALGIGRVHWVGEVTGGTMGLMAALKAPERVASVTLCNSYARMPDQTKTNYALDEASQRAAIEKYGVADWCRRTLAHRMDVSRAPRGLGEWMAREMARTPVHVAVMAFGLFSGVDLTPRLGEIRAPVLLVAGAETGAGLKRHMADTRDRLPRARLVEIDGCGYGVHFLAPGAVVAEVRRFMDEIRA